jgi:hypothetical protein
VELLALKARADKLPSPPQRNMENLQKFITKFKPWEEGQGLYFNPVDMALLGTPRENTWMDGMIEHLAHGLPLPIKV